MVAHRKEKERKRKEKTTPFNINLRSQVLYRAAQEGVTHLIKEA
jgi:hypothetical protein